MTSAVLIFLLIGYICHGSNAAMWSKGTPWSGGIVPYYIERCNDLSQCDNFGNDQLVQITKAMQHIEVVSNKCVQFKQRTTETDYISIQKNADTDNTDCFTYVGKRGGRQPLRLSKFCTDTSQSPDVNYWMGDMLHMLMQVLGYYPETNRADRDTYITINADNIQANYAHKFGILSSSSYSSPSFDPASILHYTEKSWLKIPSASADAVVMKWKDETTEIKLGQRYGLAVNDYIAIAKYYKCPTSATALSQIRCQNGGTPAGFYFCLCPAQFKGQFCEDPTGCEDLNCGTHGTCQLVWDTATSKYKNKCSCKTNWAGVYCQFYNCGSLCSGSGGECKLTCNLSNNCNIGCVCPMPRLKLTEDSHCIVNENICKNDGTMNPKTTTGLPCNCPWGWRGSHCTEVDLSACANTCQHGGTFSQHLPCWCECPKDFSGQYCQFFDPLITCTKDEGCTGGNEHCLVPAPCAAVSGTCQCNSGFIRNHYLKRCQRVKKAGEKCGPSQDQCEKGNECIDFTCQCPVGMKAGIEGDCVTAYKHRWLGQDCTDNFDSCTYNLVCAGTTTRTCTCPTGYTASPLTNYQCQRFKYRDQTCTENHDCKYVALGAVCRDFDLNSDDDVTDKKCDCDGGLPYQYMYDKYTWETTCIPPPPKHEGELCAGQRHDTDVPMKYGVCNKGLVCDLCPRTLNEWRCHGTQPVVASFAAGLYICLWSLFAYYL